MKLGLSGVAPVSASLWCARLLACAFSLLCIVLFAVVLTPQLTAQIETGGLTGTVKDATGAVLPGVHLTLTNNATGVSQRAVSTSSGTYVFESVNAGAYTLQAEQAGFQKYVAEQVQIHVQQVQTLDLPLVVGTQNQQVTVTTAAPLLQAENAAVGQTIEGAQINALPLNGRNWASLAQLSAGVTTANANYGAGPGSAYFSINGTSVWQNDFRLNGIDDNVEVYGGYGANITPPPDAIQEFKLQSSNYNAEFGHSTGGVINAIIKSGTNQLHGDLWEYFRNDKLDANNYFANQNGTPRPPYRQNQFGGTVGGPVVIPKLYDGRNKTFFFFDYQANLQHTPLQYTETVPTALMQSSGFTNLEDLITNNGGTKTDALGRVFPYGAILDPATTRLVANGAVDSVSGIRNTSGGDVYVRDPFFTGGALTGITDFTGRAAQLNQIPANRIDPNAVKILGLYPAANRPGFTNDYFQSPKQIVNTYQYDVRIDENPTPNDTLFGVWDWSHADSTIPSALPGIADGGAYGTGTTYVPTYAIALGYTHIFTPALTNEFHAGWSQNISRNLSDYAQVMGIPQQYGIQGIPQFANNGGLPQINIGGLTNLGPSEWTLSRITVLELMDNVTKVHGAHTFKMGGQFNRIGGDLTQSPTPRGQFNYGGQYSDIPNASTGILGLADFLITPGPSTVSNGIDGLGGLANWQGSNVAPANDLRYYAGVYFQDDWKVTPNFTVNLGLRWDYNTPYAEINGRQANFVQSGGDGTSAVYYMPKQGCKVPRSSDFDALLAASNIQLACVSNTAVGQTQKLNFAPRVGFAYRVTPKFVVRGGYGITYGALANIGFYGNLGNNYPFAFGQSQFSQNSQTPFLNNAGQPATLENLFPTINLEDPTQISGAGVMLNGRQYNFQTPYIESFNFFTQYQFTNHDAIQLGYVGTLGRHLDTLGSHNVPGEILPPGTNPQLYAPFPDFNYSNSQWESTDANSNYNAGQVNYEHQTSFGLTLLGNYTWSKCLTNQNGNASIIGGYRAQWLPGFGIKGDYGLCDSDAAHVIHVSGTYRLPVGRGAALLAHTNSWVDAFLGGWSLNYIYSFQSGSPFSIGCPVATTATFGCNALLVPGQGLYTGAHTPQQWLNPNAFAQPPMATSVGQTDYSPLGGGPFVARGPHLTNLDFSLFKSFAIKERSHLEFRAEAFNLLNNPQFGQPGNTAGFASTGPGNPNQFSAITYTRNNERLLQLALKLYF